MKRWILCVCTLVMLLSMSVTPVMAADTETGSARQAQRNCHRYLDTDTDGTCDNRQAPCGEEFEDADNDGVCDNRKESRNVWGTNHRSRGHGRQGRCQRRNR